MQRTFCKAAAFVLMVAFVPAILAACASATPGCARFNNDDAWIQLQEPPVFVDEELLRKMYYSEADRDRQRLVWYSDLSNRYAACSPGNRHGCGDYLVFYRLLDGVAVKEELEEITLCGQDAR